MKSAQPRFVAVNASTEHTLAGPVVVGADFGTGGRVAFIECSPWMSPCFKGKV